MPYTCFVISPIGQPNSDVRKRADALYKYVVQPAMAVFDFRTQRADHKYEVTSIVDSMIEEIQQADLCIINLTDLNPNVMYELGRRHETGKPFILLIEESQLSSLPFDTATLKTITYNTTEIDSVYTAIEEIQKHVRHLLDEGFENNAKASLSSIADTLNRLERKLSALQQSAPSMGHAGAPSMSSQVPIASAPGNPTEKFRFAARRNDIASMDALLPMLQNTCDFVRFHDLYVSVACSKGSHVAATMVKDNMERFLEQATTVKMKLEYLACYISYCSRQDLENQEMDFLMGHLQYVLNQAESEEDRAALYNQMGRLCFGAFANDQSDETAFKNAYMYQTRAAEMVPTDPSYAYNVALLNKQIGDMEKAELWIERCLSARSDDDADDDHLALACRIYKQTTNPALSKVSALLQVKNPFKWDELFN
jgi:nucleoside 2-deoxyribosyltransferase